MYADQTFSLNSVLPRDFYARETIEVARDLVGKHIVRQINGRTLAVRILETEAYRGRDDLASHARNGRTQRNRVMFGTVGISYVYFIYGMHWLFNIIAHGSDMPGGILIRAAEPLHGVEQMALLRGGKALRDLTNGPARLAQALAIDGDCNHQDLTTNPALFIAQGALQASEVVACGPRIRVPGDALAKAQPWRFWVQDHPMISR